MAVNRFSRLVELRRIREEAAAAAYKEALGEIGLRKQRLLDLDEETEMARVEMAETLGDVSTRLPSNLYLDFYRGQDVRKAQTQKEIEEVQKAAESVKQKWLETRKSLQQAEKLEEKADVVIQQEARRQEYRELDRIGVIRHHQNTMTSR
ncbi:MAG: flagellar export protein FliJ [Magnetococcales bacterium]|nr:flagellar export protein FliJ [Magnetococcales bacterium]